MERTTSSFQFYCRECKVNKQGLAPIEVCITLSGKRTFISLPRKEIPSQFKKQINQKRNNDIKEYTELFRQKLNNAITDLLRNDIPLSVHSLKEYIQGGGIKAFTIEKMFNDYIKLLETKVNITITKETKRKYEIVRDYFFETIDKNKQANSLNQQNILQFYNNLRMEKKLSEATSGSMMQKVRSIITYFFENGSLDKNCTADVKINKGKAKIEWLNKEDIQKIKNYNHPSKSLRQVKDLFLFQMNTGLSYADLMDLKRSDIQEYNGQYYIKKNRIKTGVQYMAVILQEGFEILQRYDYQLPTYTNQRYNLYLKDIQSGAGIKQNLTTHLARKTYATLMLNSGVSLNVVSKLLGHSNTNVTQRHYAFTKDETILNEVKNIRV